MTPHKFTLINRSKWFIGISSNEALAIAIPALARALRALPDDTPLAEILRDDRPAADAELPRTGVSLAWERMLSSAFIRAPGYGTRCSTVIRRDRYGWTHVVESTWSPVCVESGRVVDTFQVARA